MKISLDSKFQIDLKMTQIVLNIEDDKLKTFIDFIKTLDYVSLNLNIPQNQIDEVNYRMQLVNDGEMSICPWDDAKVDVFKTKFGNVNH